MPTGHFSTGGIQAAYEDLRRQSAALAGSLLEIPRRVVILSHIYHDSGGNHAFSQIAAHGALWARGYFEVAGTLGRLIGRRYFYNPQERAYRLGLLQEFAEGFRRVNRLVCIDTYANYLFTQRFGHLSAAADVLPANLLDALNRVHRARQRGQRLPPQELRDVFLQSFLCEQELTVAPGVKEAVAGFDCRILKFLCLRPLVRFAYFPRCRYLFFRDFSDTGERIDKGLRAFDYAARMGWDHVHNAMHSYGRMNRQLHQSPEAAMQELRAAVATQELAPPGEPSQESAP